MTEQNGTALSRLPVLPLRGLVAFPNMIIHFDVGRLLSIRALEAAMKNGQTLFLSAQRDLKTDNPSPSDLYQVGTICQVKEDTIIIETSADRVRMEFTKWAISTNVREEKAKAAQQAAARNAKAKKKAKTSGEENSIDEGSPKGE